jgi:hypothetical protein
MDNVQFLGVRFFSETAFEGEQMSMSHEENRTAELWKKFMIRDRETGVGVPKVLY